MSNTSYSRSGQSNPMSTFFDLQRQSIKQGQQLFQQGLNMQKQAPRAWQDVVESQRSVQKTGLDASRSVTKGVLEMMEASVPSEQQLSREGDSDADISEQQRDAFKNLHQAVDDQFDAFEEINDQTWETIEQQFEENADAYAEFIDQSGSFTEESVNAFVDSMEDAQSDIESQVEDAVDSASEAQSGTRGRTSSTGTTTTDDEK